MAEPADCCGGTGVTVPVVHVLCHHREPGFWCVRWHAAPNPSRREHLGEWPGPIVEEETDEVVGYHRGFWFHTVGQRKGIPLSGGPW